MAAAADDFVHQNFMAVIHFPINNDNHSFFFNFQLNHYLYIKFIL